MPAYFASGNLFVLHAKRVVRQIRGRNVAADRVAWLGTGMQRRLELLANRSEFARAARVEDAAAGSTHGARDLADEGRALPQTAVEAWHDRQQCRSVGMMRPGEDPFGGSDLQQSSEIE